jgi:MFS family permease
MFGYFGDKFGRKVTFTTTLIMMVKNIFDYQGACTTLVGCLPTYKMVGSISGYILIFLRIVQGLAIGGEYGGAVIYVAEHSPQNKRGYYTGFIQLAGPLGFLLSILMILIIKVPMESTGNTEMFLSWVINQFLSIRVGVFRS